MKQFTSRRFLPLALVGSMALISAAALSGCGGAGSANGLNAALEYSKAKVSAFSSSASARTFKFSDEVYSKANLAAMIYSGKTTAEELQQIAKNLSLDSITVTDDKGEIKACYPEGEEGKLIKETEDKKNFQKVVKGISVKLMSDPVQTEDGSGYSLFAGVARTDDAGAVIIGYTTDEYSKITGTSLADECGVNVVVAKDGQVLSSTLEGVDPSKTLEDIGVKDENAGGEAFTIKVGDKSYSCKAEKISDYTVICGEPA